MQKILTALTFFALTCAAFAEPIQVQSVEIQGNRGEVHLNQPAPNNQTWVELQSDGPLHAPMAVRIPAGTTTATFAVLVDPVAEDTTTLVHASLNGLGPTQLVYLPVEGEAATR